MRATQRLIICLSEATLFIAKSGALVFLAFVFFHFAAAGASSIVRVDFLSGIFSNSPLEAAVDSIIQTAAAAVLPAHTRMPPCGQMTT